MTNLVHDINGESFIEVLKFKLRTAEFLQREIHFYSCISTRSNAVLYNFKMLKEHAIL